MRRILIVDDEEMIVNSLAGYLEASFEIEVHRAYSSMEAMEILRRMQFCIVITDISMPVVTGLELLDFIKKYWPVCHVIVLTAYNNFEYAYSTLRYDRVDYILKIESYDVIAHTVQKHLNQLDEEERRETFYRELDEKISDMSSYLKGRALNQLFGKSSPAKQEDMDVLDIPLSLEQPVLLAVSVMEKERMQDMSYVSGVFNYVEKNMSLRNIQLIFHQINGKFLWIFQPKEKLLCEDLLVYVREVFDGVVDNMKLVIHSDCILVKDVREIFDKSIRMLDQLEKGCIRVLGSGAQVDTQPQRLIEWLNNYIDKHYTQDLSLTELASLTNYNPSYLSRLYREQTGITLVFYINSRRVECAKELLAQKNLRIKDIAEKAGFYSVKHFNEVFRKYVGMSAKDYRNELF